MRWSGHDEIHDAWESVDNLQGAKELMREFIAELQVADLLPFMDDSADGDFQV